MAITKKTDNDPIVLKPLNYQTIIVPIKGVTDLIVHNWSYKAMLEMLAKQTDGKKKGKAEEKIKKVPEIDFAESLYWISEKPDFLNYSSIEEYKKLVDKYKENLKEMEGKLLTAIEKGKFGFPAGGFKAAIVGACRMVDDLAMTTVKRMFSVSGMDSYEYVTIESNPPTMRCDSVRLETGVADIRFRATFKKWGTHLKITYNADRLTREAIVNLTNYAGYGGIGEWKPASNKSASGDYGRFEVETEQGS